MKLKAVKFLFFSFILMFFIQLQSFTLLLPKHFQVQNAAGPPDGEALFMQYCSQCHHLDTELAGPALRGLFSEKRWGQFPKSELYAFVRNAQEAMTNQRFESQDYTNELYEYWGTLMPANSLSHLEIKAILKYIEKES